MDLKLNREMLSMTRTILDASCEQAVEKDFLLPDYYPDIFRVLKCVIMPTVQSHSINGGKLSFDMAVLIRVLYVVHAHISCYASAQQLLCDRRY